MASTLKGLIVVGFLGVSAAALADPPFFVGIGDVSGDGIGSSVVAVSDDGGVAAGWGHTSTGSVAARWTPDGGLEAIGDLPGGIDAGYGLGVSGDGAVIVGDSSSADSYSSDFCPQCREAFRWTSAEGMTPLGFLPASYNWSQASSASADGSTIVGRSISGADGWEAFVWTDPDAGGEGMVSLGLLDPYTESAAGGVTPDGRVVTGTAYNPDSVGFRWTAATGMVPLGHLDPASPNSGAGPVSADGTVIAGSSGSARDNLRRAYIWRLIDDQTGEGEMMSLGVLDGFVNSDARGLSGDGSVVVGSCRSASYEFRAYIWTEAEGMRDLRTVLEVDYGLDLNGWTLQFAEGISADGRTIVGSGTNPSGGYEGWVAHLGGCAADFNGDGVVDTRDFVAFLNAWAAGDASADFDGNGVIDTRDFIAYLNLWAAGC